MKSNKEQTLFGHLMIDLETLSTSHDAVILSIAAVEFDLHTGTTGREFKMNVDIQSCIDAGLKVNGSTILWWLNQNDVVQRAITRDPEKLLKVLTDLTEFIHVMGSSIVQVWGNSNRFDLEILSNAFISLKMEIPWSFRNERDVRTLVSLKPEIKEMLCFSGNRHEPLADCLHQIKYCYMTSRALLLFSIPPKRLYGKP